MNRLPPRIILALALLMATPALPVTPDEVLADPALEARAREISRALRCPVCQGESIDDSNAGISKTLRLVVRERLVAGDSDAEIQEVMQGAYETGALRGAKLLTVKRLIDDRRRAGKGYDRKSVSRTPRKLTSSALVRAYNQEVERQKLLIRKADLVQQRLAFVSGAMGRLLSDEDFVNLLRAEGLASMPASLEPGKKQGELR